MSTEKLLIEISENGARVVKANIEGVGHAAEHTHGAVEQLKHALELVGVGFALHEAISETASFEQALAKLQVVTGATGETLMKLKTEAAEFGATTRFSATEAAESLTVLARSGLESEHALEAMGSVIDLAVSSSLDLKDAADVVGSALQRFKLGADGVQEVVNTLATAATKSRAGVSGFADAIRVVGASASASKVPFVEIGAALSALAERGEGGSRAGLALKKILTELQNPGKELVKTLDALGLKTKDVDLKQVGLVGALKNLSDAGITTTQVFQLFGDKSGAVISSLVESSDRVSELATKFREGGVNAKNAAAIMDDNLNGALLKLKSSAEAVVIELGKLGPSGGLKAAINLLGDALLGLSHNAIVLGSVIVALSVSQLPRLAGLLSSLFGLITKHPVGILLAAIGAGVGLLIQFSDKISVSKEGLATLGDVASATGEKISGVFSGLGALIESSLGAVGSGFGDAFKSAGESFQGFVRFIALDLDAIVGIAAGSASAIIAAYSNLPAALGDLFFGAVNRIIQAFNALLRVTQLTINETITAVNKASANITGGKGLDIGPVALAQFEDLKNPFETAADDLGEATRIAFQKGFEGSTGVSDFVDEVFAKANEAAAARKAAAESGSGITPGEHGGGGHEETTAAPSQNVALAKAIKDINTELAVQLDLAGRSNATRAQTAAQLEIEKQLREQGLDLAKGENEELRQGIRDQLAAIEAAKTRADVLNEIEGPEIERVQRQTALNELLRQGAITEEEYTLASENLLVATVANNDAFGGFVATLVKVQLTAKQIGETIGTFVVGAIDRASSALADFALSGFQNVDQLREAFANLFRDLAKEIIQLIIKILILKAIKAGLGGLGVDTGGAGLGASADGGNIQGGRPRLVGERGPEIFVPSTAGNVIPNNRLDAALGRQNQAPAPAPEVKVNIVNVDDPKKVTSALSSSEGEKSILNVLNKNKESIRRMVNG